jgi:CheY-like chemotaxis protein
VIDSEQQSDSISSRDGAFQMLLELPVKQTDLLELTSRATQRLIRKTDIVDAGAPVKKSVPAFSGEVTAEGELRPGAGQGNLLLAQGDPAVLRVLTDQLEDLGYRVKSVSNGRQVLEALLAEPDRYTLVLIGRKLPGMDGINTVRLARKTEMTHKMRIPLVGLLTPDEQSERHAFLEAGLDELIVLPFVAQKHAALLERLAVPHLRSRALSKGGEVRVGQAPLDESYLQGLRQLEKGNEPGLVNDLFKSYLDSTPGLIAKARHALRTPGSPELRQAVHSLRGTSGNLGAHQLARICGDLEQAAEGKDTALMMELFHRLEAEFARVRTAMLKEIKS